MGEEKSSWYLWSLYFYVNLKICFSISAEDADVMMMCWFCRITCVFTSLYCIFILEHSMSVHSEIEFLCDLGGIRLLSP